MQIDFKWMTCYQNRTLTHRAPMCFSSLLWLPHFFSPLQQTSVLLMGSSKHVCKSEARQGDEGLMRDSPGCWTVRWASAPTSLVAALAPLAPALWYSGLSPAFSVSQVWLQSHTCRKTEAEKNKKNKFFSQTNVWNGHLNLHPPSCFFLIKTEILNVLLSSLLLGSERQNNAFGVGEPVVTGTNWIFLELRKQVLPVKMFVVVVHKFRSCQWTWVFIQQTLAKKQYFHWLFLFKFACKSGSAIEKLSRSHREGDPRLY